MPVVGVPQVRQARGTRTVWVPAPRAGWLLGLGVTFGFDVLGFGLVVGLFVVGHVGHQDSRVDRSGTVGKRTLYHGNRL